MSLPPAPEGQGRCLGKAGQRQGEAVPITGLHAAVEEDAAVEHAHLEVAAATGLLANDSDKDGDVLFARLIAGPQHGTLVLRTDGGFEYRPTAGFVGTDQWRYAATDGSSAPADEQKKAS